MKTLSTEMSIQNKIFRILLGTSLMLFVPFLGMQFSKEMMWGTEDFITMGALLISAGLLYELLVSKVKKNTHRAAIGFAILAGVVLVWIELAVGIFN